MGKDYNLAKGETLKLRFKETGQVIVGRVPYESELIAEKADIPQGSF